MKPLGALGWAAVGLFAYCSVRALEVLPRERAIKREMCQQGKVYGIDWVWKQPTDLRELLFGLQEVENLRS